MQNTIWADHSSTSVLPQATFQCCGTSGEARDGFADMACDHNFQALQATVFVKLFVENRAGSSCSITPGSGFATISARSDTSTAAPSVAGIMWW